MSDEKVHLRLAKKEMAETFASFPQVEELRIARTTRSGYEHLTTTTETFQIGLEEITVTLSTRKAKP